MIITASLVKELRERTGAGMMECKKSLTEAQGDIEVAIVAMRKSGQAKAAKKAGRIAAEGAIAVKVSGDSKKAIMVEVNCETDFVARDHNFLEFVNAVAAAGLAALATNPDDLLALTLDNGKTITQAREDLVAKIGENINVRRLKLMTTVGVIGNYVHSNNRIGVLVELSAANSSELGKDISMHIAASKPIAVLPEELPQDLLNKEKEICLVQVQASGKPPEIIEKMIIGRMQKFVSESTLIKQPFVKNPDITVADLLKQANVKVLSFARFEVGEGIEKKETDFATEVKSLL
ncbi:protein chain elongation factor EF-Ts [Gammaproteobacteria bacterium]